MTRLEDVYADDMTPEQRLGWTTAMEISAWYVQAVADGMQPAERQAEIWRRMKALPDNVQVAVEENLGRIFGDGFRREAGRIPLP